MRILPKLKAIVAINNLNYIGKEGEMLWRSSEDFKHFKNMTKDATLIVGKTTFEVDLKGKELPGRNLYVVGTGYNSLWQAVVHAGIASWTTQGYNAHLLSIKKENEEIKLKSPDVWVIGGESIYTQLMPLIEEFHISRINDDQIGDKIFILPNTFKGEIFNYNFEPNKKEELNPLP